MIAFIKGKGFDTSLMVVLLDVGVSSSKSLDNLSALLDVGVNSASHYITSQFAVVGCIVKC